MKKVVIEMIHNELTGGSNAEMGLKLTDLIVQSLRWWHGQLGDKDPLKLDGWQVKSIEVTDSRRTES
ncbi:MAG TPA: hypothetical protein VNL14_13665 [Candidatus Acidoferrales bacterium]|nr:hypothetical protein [Candidatus Acidoferrales bacterium]